MSGQACLQASNLNSNESFVEVNMKMFFFFGLLYDLNNFILEKNKYL